MISYSWHSNWSGELQLNATSKFLEHRTSLYSAHTLEGDQTRANSKCPAFESTESNWEEA
jgi:hypothetical protein